MEVGQPGLFDPDERYRRLSENGDPPVKLSAPIDFERLRPAAALKRSDGSGGGRPAYDPVVMFKTPILQTLYTLSDDATEFQSGTGCRSCAFCGSAWRTRSPTPGRSGCCANNSRAPMRLRTRSPGSTPG